MKEEIEKRRKAEKLRWTERIGRTHAEQNLRKVIDEKRKESTGDGYTLKPIGHAKSCYVHCQGVPRQPGLAPLARSRIEMEEWVPFTAFDDLKQYSHIWVLFIFHMNTNISTLLKSTTDRGITFPAKVEPPRLKGKRTGLFATRSPHRPCPIGLSVVKLEEVHMNAKERYIIVSNTDIVDGSPVLDIKPYLPAFDTIPDAIVPEWVMMKQAVKSVVFSDEAIYGLNAFVDHYLYYSTADEMSAALKEVLGADVSKRSELRLSEFQFDCLSVLFSATEREVRVERVYLRNEYEKMKERSSLK